MREWLSGADIQRTLPYGAQRVKTTVAFAVAIFAEFSRESP